jgi:ribosomal protein S18 acetylase RimI-like enzyme
LQSLKANMPPHLPTKAPKPPRAGASSRPRWAPIRTLGERHRPRVLSHLLALDDDDRVRRFGHLATDERIRHYAEQLDFDRDEIFGCFDRSLRVAALVHLAFGGDAVAEFGISVSAQARGEGLGTALFEHAVTHARNRGVRTLVIHLARDNAAMLAIVRRAGARVAFEGSDVVAELPLPADTLGTQIAELLGHHAAALDYRIKLQVLRLLPGQAAR